MIDLSENISRKFLIKHFHDVHTFVLETAFVYRWLENLCFYWLEDWKFMSMGHKL